MEAEQPVARQLGEVVVVTGMTGAGRSTAAKELEDLGFYVVDNLPPSLLADVNPTFAWVRLAQRVPVRIAVERVPEGVHLLVGRTATVNIKPR